MGTVQHQRAVGDKRAQPNVYTKKRLLPGYMVNIHIYMYTVRFALILFFVTIFFFSRLYAVIRRLACGIPHKPQSGLALFKVLMQATF